MSTIYTKLVSKVLFPLHEKMKGHDTVKIRNKMEKQQWWSRDNLEKLRVQRLRRLLMSAGNKVPYYCDLFAKLEFDPKTVESVDDIQALPFLTKNIIRENFEKLKAKDARNLSKFNTGGSSGEPLSFYISRERVSHDVAAKWRATTWWNVDIGDPEVVVWGSPIELGAQDKIKHVLDKLFRTTLFSAFDITDRTIEEFITLLKTIKPKMLFGYPSSIAYMASYAERKNIVVSNLGIKVVFVTSERLYDNQRETISRIFSCPVANGYGGRDAGFIAHECPSGGIHITADDIIVEIVDNNDNVLPLGESGEIVVTHLATSDYPFIRYKTGDVGILDENTCSCGRTLPLLKEIQGRTTDFVIAKNGTVMHGLSLIYVIRELAGIETFKIVQESIDKTTLTLVVTNEFDKKNETLICREYKKMLGELVQIDIQYVSSIAREKSGKFRYITSNVTAGTV
ncbi:MAG: phenylacetate--CoA ligase family protein [Thiohalomonadales bacterium]